MPTDSLADDAHSRADKLVTARDSLSPAERETIVEAVAEDLRVESEARIAAAAVTDAAAEVASARLVKVETQTRVLSDALIAITDQSGAVAPAIKAVKDEM